MIEQMTLVMSNTSRTLSQNVTVSVIEGSGSVAVPGAAELLGTTTHNFPNPFNPTTLISYDLPVDAPVSLEVFDSNGRLVRTLIERRTVKAGLNQVRWDGRGDAGEQLATGVYYYRLTAGPRELYRKMILVK
jgi:flagellar hook assembly protein FlgD